MKAIVNIMDSAIARLRQIQNSISIDYEQLTDMEFEDINHMDYPDYSDVHISYAECRGVPLTDMQLDQLNENRDFVYESLMNYLY